jgi:hypothetical protein
VPGLVFVHRGHGGAKCGRLLFAAVQLERDNHQPGYRLPQFSFVDGVTKRINGADAVRRQRGRDVLAELHVEDRRGEQIRYFICIDFGSD